MVVVKLIVVFMWLLLLHACVGCGSCSFMRVYTRVGCGSYVVGCCRLWFLCCRYFMRVVGTSCVW